MKKTLTLLPIMFLTSLALATPIVNTTQPSMTDQILINSVMLFAKTIIPISTAIGSYTLQHPMQAILITIILGLIILTSIVLSIRKTAEYIYYKITAKPETKLPKTAITITLLTILTATFKILFIVTLPLILLLTLTKIIQKIVTFILKERRKNQNQHTPHKENKGHVTIEQIE